MFIHMNIYMCTHVLYYYLTEIAGLFFYLHRLTQVRLLRVIFYLKKILQPLVIVFQSSVQECAAAFVFFRTRYAASVASQVLQTSNPMLWVTDLAPEPHDVYWSNLWLPYRQLWIRQIGTLLASIVFMFLFLVPVTFVQGLSQLDQLQQVFPFLKVILNK